jgi:type 2 lantibiotic biosynthesis protein LanM
MACHFIFPESSEWYHAVTLPERIESISQCRLLNTAFNDEPICRRLDRWHTELPDGIEDYIAQVLTAHEINGEHLFRILSEPIEDVRDRLGTPPSWLQSVISAFSSTESSDPVSFGEVEGGTTTVLFLHLVEPLLRQASHRLCCGMASLRHEFPGLSLDEKLVGDALLRNVERQLLQMLIPTLVLELNVARVQEKLSGETREQRFDSFVARLRNPEISLSLLREYPVLARQVVICLDHWVSFSLEFLRHLGEDWLELCMRFGGVDLGTIISLDDSKGDRHQDGRSVLIVTFTSGLRIVYKPRPLALAMHFQELLTWLNERGAQPPFRTVKILDRGTYGWIEFISPQDCTSIDEVRRFYERQGEYLALLYALEASDFHYENLIASGEHPILVDLETLCQPCMRDRDQAIDGTYRDSVLRVGLLPQRLFANGQSDGIDLSGLGAAAGQPLPYPVLQLEAPCTDEMRLIQKGGESAGRTNQPRLGSLTVEMLDFVEEITVGFSNMYRLLQRYRGQILSSNGPLARFANDSIRVILRPTLTYGLLLRSSFHPDALRDALDRDVMFGSLCDSSRSSHYLERIVRSEIDDLRNGDIPLFSTTPASLDLQTSSGATIKDFFPETGMSLVHRRIRHLSESDYVRQLWFVRASLAAMAAGQKQIRLSTRTGRGEELTSATGEQLIAAAETVGARLESLAVRSGKDVSWIGLTLTKKANWSLVPLGLDLYSGLSGLAFFLAYLGYATHEPRYTTLARAAVRTIRRHLSEIPLHRFSVGVFDGLGGVVYLFTHLGIIWRDQELILEAKRIAQSSRTLIFYDRKFDVTSGSAGCIMSLRVLQSVAPSENILAAAVECGDHLLAHAQSLHEGIAWPPYFPAKGPLTGFAHGASGIALALLELSNLSGEKRFKEAALKAFSYENSLFSPEWKNWPDLREMDNGSDGMFMVGWCHGAPGIALARLRALQYTDGPLIRRDIAAGLDTTLSLGFRGDHSLCHGSLGNIEPLLQAIELLAQTPWSGHVDQISASILQGIRDNGWLCGVPLSVESPGLMTGIAGIGYGLLRLADPLNIPSLLTLAPPILRG